MFKIIVTLFLLLNLFVVYCYTSAIPVQEDSKKNRLKITKVLVESKNEEFEIKETDADIDETDTNGDEISDEVVNDEVSPRNSALHKVSQKYYCTANVSEESYLLMYGAKSWNFPRQTVNLTLAYPPEHQTERDYLITEFEVTVYIDGGRSRAYLTSGGLMKDKISLYVTSEDITCLSFQFKVYGIAKVSYVPTRRIQYQCG